MTKVANDLDDDDRRRDLQRMRDEMWAPAPAFEMPPVNQGPVHGRIVEGDLLPEDFGPLGDQDPSK